MLHVGCDGVNVTLSHWHARGLTIGQRMHPAAAMDGSAKVGSVGAADPLALPPVWAMNAGDRKQGARIAEPSRA